jgi:type III restriction enzyme
MKFQFEIQTENTIKLSPSLVKELGAVSLDVEMETGTGKTHVYIKNRPEFAGELCFR